MKRALIIISNENILDAKPFIRDVKDNENYVTKIKDFNNKYKLGITCEELGVEEDDVAGLEWHRKIASLGHIVIATGFLNIAFLLSKISYKQYE